ncbi:hypothetical protein V6N13_057221 [Hibiscus sabdariffa]|uniref:Uncharacterized protein n=2 Tax=Hibiscus sabdariffa TaxID=183260 RepID=A0ABR1ZG47_9ROSI
MMVVNRMMVSGLVEMGASNECLVEAVGMEVDVGEEMGSARDGLGVEGAETRLFNQVREPAALVQAW